MFSKSFQDSVSPRTKRHSIVDDMMMKHNSKADMRTFSTILPKLTKVRSNVSEEKEQFDPVTAHSEILVCLEDSKKNF